MHLSVGNEKPPHHPLDAVEKKLKSGEEIVAEKVECGAEIPVSSDPQRP